MDCWRVEVCEPDACLRLAAEIDAAGLFGRFYWHALYPIHVLLFGGLLRSIARRAVRAVPADTAPYS